MNVGVRRQLVGVAAFHHEGSGAQAQIIRLGVKPLLTELHLGGPKFDSDLRPRLDIRSHKSPPRLQRH